MAADISDFGTARAGSLRAISTRSHADILRLVAVAAGLAWAIAFPLIGVRYELQTYGDGSLFSYAVAAQDVWAFHWHNISARVFVYLAALLPAEVFVGLTGDARGGIALYGLLFFAAPLVGLTATFAADRSAGRIFFTFACGSTACVCPLVFGSPTEMWMAHAVFWPALAAAHFARAGIAGSLIVLASMLTLVLTHEGALLLAAAIVASLLPYGTGDARFRRAGAAFAGALLVWIAVKFAFPPDPYISVILMKLAARFFNITVFTGDLMLLLLGTIAGYGIAFHLLSRLDPAAAPLRALAATLVALAAYWLLLDHSLHAENRYYLRTVVMIITPVLGMLATARVLHASGRLFPMLPSWTARLLPVRANIASPAALACIILIVTLVHAVETAKFVSAWTDYKAAVRALAAGPASDAALGDRRFVSAVRLDPENIRIRWPSTTPYLSVLVTPGFDPAHLVVAPEANFFWLSCETAAASFEAAGALPPDARGLLRSYSCLHRKPVATAGRQDNTGLARR